MPKIRGTWDRDFSHAHERMKVAVESLVSTGSMEDRLGNALHTMFHFLHEDEFPEELRMDYQSIISECSTVTNSRTSLSIIRNRLSPRKNG